MRARCFAVIVGGLVIATRAVGPEADGTYPAVPANWVPITLAQYQAMRLGTRWDGSIFAPPEPDGDETDPIHRDTPAERLWRQRARLIVELRQINQAIAALTARMGTAETRITNHTAILANLNTRVTDLDARVTALENAP